MTEAEEGRVRANENIAQVLHEPDTERGTSVPGLRGVRQAARERRQEWFTALHHLLRDSFLALKRQAAPAVDGVTYNAANQTLTGIDSGTYNVLEQLTSIVVAGNAGINLTYNYPTGANNGEISSM